MRKTEIPSVNGVPYPLFVDDEISLLEWISSIKRETGKSDKACALDRTDKPFDKRNGHREVIRIANFHKDVQASETTAKHIVCQQMAMELFDHLINVPNGKLIWRIEPEFDVSHDTIPLDLSQIMTRQQMDTALGYKPLKTISLVEMKNALGKEDWGHDFVTDTIFPAASSLGEWRRFKSYMRYSVVLGDEVIPHTHNRGIAA